MAKSANLYARIEPEIKEQAEKFWPRLVFLLPMLSICSISRLSYREGLPFEVKIPDSRPLDVSMLSTEELHAELEKGYADMKAGQIKDAKTVFSDIRKDYGV